MADYISPHEQATEAVIEQLNEAVRLHREYMQRAVNHELTPTQRAEARELARTWSHKAALLEKRRARLFEET